ncbi:MAG: long-chain acyl-CoA synthetase, partial [Paraglaciecola sp.]
MSLKTPLEMFYQWEQTHPDTVYLKQPVDGVNKDFTWRETGQQAR